MYHTGTALDSCVFFQLDGSVEKLQKYGLAAKGVLK